MATQDDILTLEQLKNELRFEPSEDYFDELLGPQIDEALSFVENFTGLQLDDLQVNDKRLPLIRRAAILLCRDSFDGKAELRPNAAVYAMLRPIRISGG